jgi:hypothetical protein
VVFIKGFTPVFQKSEQCGLYEKVIEIQLADYFDKIFNPFYVLLDVAMDVRPHCSDFWKTGVKPLIKTTM